MCSWVSKLSIFCGTGDQEKEEVKDVGPYNYKMVKDRRKGTGFDSQ